MATGLIEQEQQTTGMAVGTAMASGRVAQEVQAAMVVAKRFPRDEDNAVARILKACNRKSLAEQACYEYTKGTAKVTGPSIRLAEVLAQNWGNIDFGFVELERRKANGVGNSLVSTHAWDLETNTRRSIVFEVRHWRDTKGGGYAITDERDIYELIANQAARRMRACILAVIPGDIQDAAVDACDKTLAGQSSEPLSDRVRVMLAKFLDVSVTKDMIEAKLGHKIDAITQQQFARLGKIFTSIRDGVGTVVEHFPPAPSDKPSTLGDLAGGKTTDKQKANGEKAKTETKPVPTEAKPEATETATLSAGEIPPLDAYAADLEEAKTVKAAGIVYDKWFGPESREAWTPDQCVTGLTLYEARKAVIRKAEAAAKVAGDAKE